MSKSQKPQPSSPATTERRTFLAGLDPLAIAELLDSHFENEPDSPYQQMLTHTRAAFLAQWGPSAVHFAALLTSVDAFIGVENAIRQSGFVTGFNACRELLLGEIDLEALKAELPDGAQ
jgi:hypothetical protein